MSKITLIAKLTAADGKADQLADELSNLCAAAAEEPGLEVYSAHRSNDEDNVFYFFEMYADGDALAVHGKGDGMKAAMASVGALLGGRPEITMMSPVAAKGIDI